MHRESCFLGFETGGRDVVDIAPSPCNLIFNVTHNFFSVHWNAHSGGVFILYVKQKVYIIIFGEFYIFLFSFWFIISNHCDFPPFEIHFSCLLCLNPCSNLKEYLHGPLLIDVHKCIGILRETVFWLKYSEQQHAEHLSIERGTPADFWMNKKKKLAQWRKTLEGFTHFGVATFNILSSVFNEISSATQLQTIEKRTPHISMYVPKLSHDTHAIRNCFAFVKAFCVTFNWNRYPAISPVGNASMKIRLPFVALLL